MAVSFLSAIRTVNKLLFFVYPTSYLDRTLPYGYNAPLKESKINVYTDYTAILYQASVFNEVGKIYAPRYRQANILAYYPVTPADTIKAIAAFELAYSDVKKAFEYYLKYEPNDIRGNLQQNQNERRSSFYYLRID